MRRAGSTGHCAGLPELPRNLEIAHYMTFGRRAGGAAPAAAARSLIVPMGIIGGSGTNRRVP